MRVLNESYLPEAPENLDLMSVFSGIISIGSVTLILLQGNDWGWFSKKIIFLFFLGLLVTCIFFISCKRSRNPLLDLELFNNHKYRQATIAAGIHQVAFFCLLFFVTYTFVRNLGMVTNKNWIYSSPCNGSSCSSSDTFWYFG